MKNKQGFTLVELIAVIAVLAIILLIGIPTVSKIVKDNKQNLYDVQITSFIDSVKTWSMDHTSSLPLDGEYITITLGELINKSYAYNTENPLTGEPFDTNITFCILNVNDNYFYKLKDENGCLLNN